MSKSPINNVKPEDVEKLKRRYEAVQRAYAKVHLSRQPLYKAIFKSLPTLANLSFDTDHIATTKAIIEAWEVAIKIIVGQGHKNPKTGKTTVTGGLGELTRTWFISCHWLFDVCNPRYEVNKKTGIADNPKWSPFRNNMDWNGAKVRDQFHELDKLVDDERNDKLVPQRDKRLINADAYKAGYWDFGKAWDADGNIILCDAAGRPLLDGWSKHIYDLTNAVVIADNGAKDRYTVGLLVFHTKDYQENMRDGLPERTGAHAHIYLELAKKKTRLQMMRAFGFDDEFWIKTLLWASHQDSALERVTALLNQLLSELKNFQKVINKTRTRKYLIHQSTDAINKEKATYRPCEVFTWFPRRRNLNYEDFAGVYDDTPVNVGHDAIVRNLHNALNRKNGTALMVGHRPGDNRFTYQQLEELHQKHGDLIAFFDMVYKDEVDVNDYSDMVKGALDEKHALQLLKQTGHDAVLKEYDKLKSDFIDMQVREPLTKSVFYVHSLHGGAGKTRLANALGAVRNQLRDGYDIVAWDPTKTFDPFSNYDGQRFFVGDELTSNWFSYSEFKDLIDPHKNVTMSSRYTNKPLWNVRDGFFTQVMDSASLIKSILMFSPGITNRGYLEKNPGYRDGDSDVTMYRIKHDVISQMKYVSDLSQLLRRMKFDISIETLSGKRTKIVVSIVNFRSLSDNASLNELQKMGYVHTAKSEHTFNALIDESMSNDEMLKIAKQVNGMVNDLAKEAQQAFDDGAEWLCDVDGFITTPMQFFDVSDITASVTNDEFTDMFMPTKEEKQFREHYDHDCYSDAKPSRYYRNYSKMKIKLITAIDNANLHGSVVELSVSDLHSLTDYEELINSYNKGGSVELPNGQYVYVLDVLHDWYQLSMWHDGAKLLTPVTDLVEPDAVTEPSTGGLDVSVDDLFKD